MTPSQVRTTIEQAMKDKQPSLRAQMKADGTLNEYLNRLAATVQEQMEAAHNDLANDRKFQAISDPTLKVQEANARLKAAEEVALSQAIEELASQPA